MKVVVVSLALLLCGLAGICQSNESTLQFADRPGAYVIYSDPRFGELAYVGLCYLGGDTLALRSFVPRTGAEVNLVLGLSLDDTGNSVTMPSVRILKGDLGNSESSMRIVPMVLNWTNGWLHSRDWFSQSREFEYSEDDEFHFSYWVPVLNILSISGAERGDLRIVTAGIIKSLEDPEFFAFTGAPAARESEAYIVEALPESPVTIDGLSVPLDANWQTEDGRVFRIRETPPQDAVLMIETLDLAEYGIKDSYELIKYSLLADQDAFLVAADTRVYELDGLPCLSYRLLDPTTGFVTVQYKLFFDRGDSVVSMATLAAFESLYLANKAYFDAILF